MDPKPQTLNRKGSLKRLLSFCKEPTDWGSHFCTGSGRFLSRPSVAGFRGLDGDEVHRGCIGVYRDYTGAINRDNGKENGNY